MNNYFILLAAGKGKRFNSKLPKQYINYNGKMMIEHSIDKAIESKIFKKIIIVINNNHRKYLRKIKNNKILIINGGKERRDSSLKALKFIKKFKPNKVFIHDGARPNFSITLLKKLNIELIKNNAVVPYINTNNSVKLKSNSRILNLDRNQIYLTQTPQCFDYKILYKLSINNKSKVTDECSLFAKNNLKVKFIKGEIINKKITNQNDVDTKKTFFGIGFDVHRLIPKRKLYLGGLKIKSKLGTLGHSDGDPVLHAITDAILGACKMGDIGEKFSNKDKRFKNVRSTLFLKKVIKEIKSKKYHIINLDINIITQTPKIQKYKAKMIKIISSICNVPENQVNIKGKTTEKLGIIGKEKAIASEVIASIIKHD